MATLNWIHGARSIIELVGDGQFSFEVTSDSLGVVCGLNSNDLSTHPEEITHGFLVQRGTYCIVEHGTPMTPFMEASAGTMLFGIYRVGQQIYYTAQSLMGDTQTAYVPGAMLYGQLIYTSSRPSTGTVFLDSSFGSEWDAIDNARLYDLEPADQNAVSVVLTPWHARGSDTASNLTDVQSPAWRAAASDLMPNRVRTQTSQWTARAGITIFDTPFNEVRAILPGWGTEDPKYKSRPKRLPGWHVRAIGPNQTRGVAPAWHARAGDAINAAHLVLRAWESRSMAPAASGVAYGEVVLPSLGPLPFQGVPMVLVLGGSITPYATVRLSTEPMALVLAGTGYVLGNVTLPAVPMPVSLGGGGQPYVTAILGAEAMVLVLGGAITAQAATMLPVMAFTIVLGGQVGLVSGMGEVFAMNMTGGPGGTTRYVGYEFNSFAKIGGRYYGAGRSGLYLLEGDDDAGKPITATFGLGQLDFGNPQLKTARYCYLGAAAGAMELNLQALFLGSLVDYTYSARGHGQSMREVRFDLGRGLRSTYLTPTFSNVNGDYFEVDTVRFLINESTRRI